MRTPLSFPLPAGVPATVEIPNEPLTTTLDNAAAAFPDRVALSFLGADTTYRELARRVECAAQALYDLGVRPGDRVALVVPNCPAHIVAFYAILRIGAIVVEHNPTYTADALAHQLADSGSVVAILWQKAIPAMLAAQSKTNVHTVIAVDLAADLPRNRRLALKLPLKKARKVRDALQGPVPDSITHWHNLVAGATPISESHPRPEPDDVALLQYTGGTTGTPKAAVLSHRNLAVNALQGQAWTQVTPGTEVIYGVLPFFHAFGLTLCLNYAIRIAATLVVFPTFDPEMVLAEQRRQPGTFLPAVPPMLDRLAAAAEKNGTDMSSFKRSISSAMALPAETARRWEAVTGGIVCEGYGMTETSPVALGSPLTEERRPGTLGLPFPSTSLRIVNPEDPTQDVEPGGRGELLINGPQVFQGYWGRPEETAHQLLEGGWLRTGDIVEIHDGYVVLVDRIKEMIVTGGFKVYPSQVEDHLRTMPGIADVAVIGVPGGDMGERVVAAVVLDEAHAGHGLVDLDAVRAWCEQRLARYAMPRQLIIVPELPRSPIGKTLRRVVRDNVLAGAV